MRRYALFLLIAGFLAAQTLPFFPFFRNYSILYPLAGPAAFIFQDQQQLYLNGLELAYPFLDQLPESGPVQRAEFDPLNLTMKLSQEGWLEAAAASSVADLSLYRRAQAGEGFYSLWAESYNSRKGRENHLSLFWADAPADGWGSALFLNFNSTRPVHNPDHRRLSLYLSGEKRSASRNAWIHLDALWLKEYGLSSSYTVDLLSGQEQAALRRQVLWLRLKAGGRKKLGSFALAGDLSFEAGRFEQGWKGDEKIYLCGSPCYRVSWEGTSSTLYSLYGRLFAEFRFRGLRLKAGAAAQTAPGGSLFLSPYAHLRLEEKLFSKGLQLEALYMPVPLKLAALAPLSAEISPFLHYTWQNGWKQVGQESLPKVRAGTLSFLRRFGARLSFLIPAGRSLSFNLTGIFLREEGFPEDAGEWERVEERKLLYGENYFTIYEVENLTDRKLESFTSLYRQLYGAYLSFTFSRKALSLYGYVSFSRCRGSVDSLVYVPFLPAAYTGYGNSFLMDQPSYDPSLVAGWEGDASFGNGWRAFLMGSYRRGRVQLFAYTLLFPNAPKPSFVTVLGLAQGTFYYPAERPSWREASRNALGGGMLRIDFSSFSLLLGGEGFFRTRYLYNYFLDGKEQNLLLLERQRVFIAVLRSF